MYAHIRGKLEEINPASAVVDCSGVGYELHISLYTFEKIKSLDQVKLYTHLSIKEDAHTLYGFFEAAERTLFRSLISVQGIGAATARMILSSVEPSELKQAISHGNLALLKSIKGVGPKSAQRIILELQDKMQRSALELGSIGGKSSLKDEASAALQMLGFTKMAVEKVIQKIVDEDPNKEYQVEDIIKIALKRL